MESIGAAFLRPDALPDDNHIRGMQYHIVLNIIFTRDYYSLNQTSAHRILSNQFYYTIILIVLFQSSLLLLVVSLHQSDPFPGTFFCDIVVNHEIMSVTAAGTQGDAPSSDQHLYNHTWCHSHLYISTFICCVCSVPFSCGVCSGISIQSMYLMHHLLDTHLGFVVACGVQIAGAETTAPICEWMGSDIPYLFIKCLTF